MKGPQMLPSATLSVAESARHMQSAVFRGFGYSVASWLSMNSEAASAPPSCQHASAWCCARSSPQVRQEAGGLLSQHYAPKVACAGVTYACVPGSLPPLLGRIIAA